MHSKHSFMRFRPIYACICINCKWVDNCQTYHWIESMHKQPHLSMTPLLEPRNPQIQVFISNNQTDKDICNYDADTDVSVEYDVFACDSFYEDKGVWSKKLKKTFHI